MAKLPASANYLNIMAPCSGWDILGIKWAIDIQYVNLKICLWVFLKCYDGQGEGEGETW